MMEWLLLPIDLTRAHEVSAFESWHGRLMTLAWGILAPLAVFVSRFFKVVPGQDWPKELDNQIWWHSHWIGHVCVLALTISGVALVLGSGSSLGWHHLLGYAVVVLVVAQVLLGMGRGTKGGPTAPAADGSWRGDHYDMTRRRLRFELLHKSLGYCLLSLAAVALLTGLWLANAPRWMWMVIIFWWSALLVASAFLQKRGWAIDTYQAIWGPGPEHPGNREGDSRVWND